MTALLLRSYSFLRGSPDRGGIYQQQQQQQQSHNCAKLFNQIGRKIIFVFKLILYTLVGVIFEKIALVVKYCLKSG